MRAITRALFARYAMSSSHARWRSAPPRCVASTSRRSSSLVLGPRRSSTARWQLLSLIHICAYATVKMVEVADRDPAKSGGEEAGRELEGKGILAAIPERSHVVLLDIGGKERSSEEIAAHLDDLMLRGESSITFVIGGSCGVSPEVRARADERLSFGRITLPHNLARVVLLEQVYRCLLYTSRCV